jgi:hypothetical protein
MSTSAILDVIHEAVARELAANIVTPGQLRGNGLFIRISGLPMEEPGIRYLAGQIRQSLCGTFLVGEITLSADGVSLLNDRSKKRSLVRLGSTHYA